MNEPTLVTCYRHPERFTHITCRRCGRPICGECMVSAPVGFQCPACVRSHTRATRQNQGIFGGELSTNPRLTTIFLIGINLVVWGAIQLAGFLKVQDQVVQFLGLSPQGLCLTGQDSSSYWSGVTQAGCQTIAGAHWVPGVADGAWWQVVTSIFTHVSILHIGVNCLSLWFLGPVLETLLGRGRFLATYLIAGLTGSLAVYWLSPTGSLSYGGSGSLFGLMGALLLMMVVRRLDVRQLLLWLGLNVLITFIGGAYISWQAHLGGFIGGVIIACVWALVPSSSTRSRTQWLLLGAFGIVIVVGLVARTLMLV